MQLAIPAALVSALLVGLGLRVLRQARTGGGLPDRMVGLFFVCVGLGGAPALLANDPGVVPPSVAPLSMAAGHAVMSVGFTALYVFAWRCFGPRSSWRRALAIGGGLALAALWGVQGLVEGYAPPGGAVVRATALVRGTALAWAFAEALRYRGMMRRRLALGLADPLVANRFTLWCCWIGSMLGTALVAIGVRFLVPDYGVDSPPALRLGISFGFMALATLGGLSLWLAFFPPRWYAARIRAAALA